MIVRFENTEYGTIECDSQTRLAYFQFQDFEAPISEKGFFRDYFGCEFLVLFPVSYMQSQDAILEVYRPVIIGRVATIPIPLPTIPD